MDKHTYVAGLVLALGTGCGVGGASLFGAGGGAGMTDAAVDVPTAGGPCQHDPCEVGGALDPACDPGVATVCGEVPDCCAVGWATACAYNYNYTGDHGQPTTVPRRCSVYSGSCAPHDACIAGEPLDVKCNLCVFLACQNTPSCCTVAWTTDCVTLVQVECPNKCL